MSSTTVEVQYLGRFERKMEELVLLACMTGRRRGGRRDCTRACEDEAIRCILYHDSEVGNHESQLEHVSLGSYTTLVPPLPTPPGPLQ